MGYLDYNFYKSKNINCVGKQQQFRSFKHQLYVNINAPHCQQSVYTIVTNTVERSFTLLLQHSACSGALVLGGNEKGVAVVSVGYP